MQRPASIRWLTVIAFGLLLPYFVVAAHPKPLPSPDVPDLMLRGGFLAGGLIASFGTAAMFWESRRSNPTWTWVNWLLGFAGGILGFFFCIFFFLYS